METRHLIDAIVRQTTVLIAQLSTAAGIRAPLAKVADQVFLELSRELEAQGVTRKVAADMFGLALRSYQKKISRLSETSSTREQTLWSAVLEYLRSQGGASRHAVLARFRDEDPFDLGAVLKDLVTSGLVSSTGRGPSTFYEIASSQARKAQASDAEFGVIADLIWLAIYDHQQIAQPELLSELPFAREVALRAIDGLLAEGRIERAENGPRLLRCTRLLIPVGAEHGWEAAVFDHYRAVSTAIAAKLRASGGTSRHGDRVGGSTISFDLEPGHPLETQVYGLLERVRADVNALWNRVVEHNRAHGLDPEKRIEVTFYFGQNVVPNDLDVEDVQVGE